MSEDEARVTARISGRVQGVGFRFFTVDEARARLLVGYAANLPDGDVEVVAEGPRLVLEDLLAALRKGPPAARVERVQPVWDTVEGKFSDFQIRF